MGTYVDSLKFAGGSFCLMPEGPVREIIELCHRHNVLVSTGGFLERALPLGPDAVERCLDACRALGFDTIEISSGLVTATVLQKCLRACQYKAEASGRIKSCRNDFVRVAAEGPVLDGDESSFVAARFKFPLDRAWILRTIPLDEDPRVLLDCFHVVLAIGVIGFFVWSFSQSLAWSS
jgi:hypothetical protein